MTNSTNTTIGIELPSYLPGQIVPRSFRPDYVFLSYLVSFIGAWTALELISRRTALRGHYNWFLLAGSSFSVGGIALWSMHFIGTWAIVLDGGRPQLQIIYSAGYTGFSFLMPVVVLLLVFTSVGSRDTTSATRIVLGGALTGFTICGMHYLGQAGISNYDCVYPISFVLGATILAVVASIIALSIFFQFRLAWDARWWRRPICAVVLASAVSGTHWIASVGTQYRLKHWNPSPATNLSRTSIVIVVLVLAICGCIVLIMTMLLAQWRLAKLAKRAQQLVLATAIFDNDGRILVTADGLLPNKKITNTWIERSLDDFFSVSHPIFFWIFNVTRNWNAVSNLLPGMRKHVHRAGLKRRCGSRFESNLLNDHGTPIEDYSLIFRELFCVAASNLADDMHEPLDKMGVLFDEIVATGQPVKDAKNAKGAKVDFDLEGLVGAKGQLLFLVRCVDRREAEHLQTSGYRFAEPARVIPLLAESLRVGPKMLTQRMEKMRQYASEDRMLEPGVHLAVFAIRASLGGGRRGFDVLARNDAKHLLPTMQFPFDEFEDWQLDYLKTMDSMTMAAVMKTLSETWKKGSRPENEKRFAKQVFKTIEAIKEECEDSIFYDAKLIAHPIRAPCRGVSDQSPPGFAILITFRVVLALHSRAPGKKLIYVPFNFFRMQQQVYKNASDHAVFARNTRREFAPILDLENDDKKVGITFGSHLFGNGGSPMDNGEGKRSSSFPLQVQSSGFANKRKTAYPSEAELVDKHSQDGEPLMANINNEGVGTEQGGRKRSATSRPASKILEQPEVRRNAQKGSVESTPKESAGSQAYIDEMFTVTIALRN